MSQEQKARAKEQEEAQANDSFQDLDSANMSQSGPQANATDDIADLRNGTIQVGVQPENLGPEGRHNSTQQRAPQMPDPVNSNDPMTDPANVTPEDRAMLSAADQNRDMNDPDNEESMLDTADNDGDPLNEQAGSYGTQGADLDVPGSENDDANEDIGEEDEENNYYSLGGDRVDDALEDNNTEI